MIKIFRKFDPRLAAELKTQRRPIFIGLACAIVTSLLTTGSIPLAKFSLQAIEQKDTGRLLYFCLAIVALFGLKYGFTRGQVYFLSYAANRLASCRSMTDNGNCAMVRSISG